MDTLGPADKYEARLASLFPGIEFAVRSKADSLFPVVGAASIVAKVRAWERPTLSLSIDLFVGEQVTRDKTLEAWFQADDCGSGYPSDPRTVRWLQGNLDPVFGYSRLVRFSWSSCARILDERGIPVEWHQDDGPATAKVIHAQTKLSALHRIKDSSGLASWLQ